MKRGHGIRYTTTELHAMLHAITSVTAGDGDGWRRAEWRALEAAEDKVRTVLHARADYDAVDKRIEASPEIGTAADDDDI